MSAFIVAMCVYIIPLRPKIENYFENDKITAIKNDISALMDNNKLIDDNVNAIKNGMSSLKNNNELIADSITTIKNEMSGHNSIIQ